MKAPPTPSLPKMLRHTMWLAAIILAGLAGHARADGPDDTRIERLVRQLGSEKFEDARPR
jgi:hypothetical protein